MNTSTSTNSTHTNNTVTHSTVNARDPWRSQSVKICRVVAETPGVATWDLQFCNPNQQASFRYLAGQFNMLYLPGIGEVAISISGDPSQQSSLLHTIRVAGNVTSALAKLPEGSTLGLRGPFGSHWPTERCAGRDVILVAGGIGLAPLRPAIYELLLDRERYGKVSLLIGAREPSGLLYTSEFETWRQQGVDVQVTVDRPAPDWTGHVGMVTTLLDRLPLQHPAETMLMTCGPEVMMWYTTQLALARGLRAESVFVSLERHMNCAIGLCGRCQFGPHFLCKEGPVFAYDRVGSILKMEDL